MWRQCRPGRLRRGPPVAVSASYPGRPPATLAATVVRWGVPEPAAPALAPLPPFTPGGSVGSRSRRAGG
eukprot:2170941-Lingulodinium_polyedra.AAC.1